MTDEQRNEFTTSGGMTLKIRPVSQLLIDKVRSSVPVPDAPKYADKIELPGQEPVVRYYTMKDGSEAGTPEEREAWDKYLSDLAAARALQTQRMLEAILLPGAGLDLEVPADDTWRRMQEYLGVTVPTDEIALKAHYLLTQVLVSPDDLTGLIVKIMQSSGVAEEAIRQAEDSFRRSVRKPGRDETEGTEST